MAKSAVAESPQPIPGPVEEDPLWMALDAVFRTLVLNRVPSTSYGEVLQGEFLIIRGRGGEYFVDQKSRTAVPMASVSYAIPA
jgi:hypothetical protein